MIDIIISLILYTLFGLIGILLFKRINFTKNIFNKKQSAIYLSIYYIVFGFFLGQLEDGNPDIRYQIGFGLGHYFVCFIGIIYIKISDCFCIITSIALLQLFFKTGFILAIIKIFIRSFYCNNCIWSLS